MNDEMEDMKIKISSKACLSYIKIFLKDGLQKSSVQSYYAFYDVLHEYGERKNVCGVNDVSNKNAHRTKIKSIKC